jgi:hypothetical protein
MNSNNLRNYYSLVNQQENVQNHPPYAVEDSMNR